MNKTNKPPQELLRWEPSPEFDNIYLLLHRLGLTSNFPGYHYLAYGLWLCGREPERLEHVTKWLYPDIASHYCTNWHNVEHHISRMLDRMWLLQSPHLELLPGYPFPERPRPSRFLLLLSQAAQNS